MSAVGPVIGTHKEAWILKRQLSDGSASATAASMCPCNTTKSIKLLWHLLKRKGKTCYVPSQLVTSQKVSPFICEHSTQPAHPDLSCDFGTLLHNFYQQSAKKVSACFVHLVMVMCGVAGDVFRW